MAGGGGGSGSSSGRAAVAVAVGVVPTLVPGKMVVLQCTASSKPNFRRDHSTVPLSSKPNRAAEAWRGNTGRFTVLSLT